MTVIGKRVTVLGDGWIELLDVMGNDSAIVEAARVSYLGETKGADADKKLLFYLMEHRHTTPFEMVEFKFRLHAPLVALWHLVRHRTFSFNAQSGRYTVFDESGVYTPAVWRLQSPDDKQASRGELNEHDSNVLTEKLIAHYNQSFELYAEALGQGVARERARLFLPGFAVYYTWVAKVDAHNLMHFLRLRMDPTAQYEIGEYARAIYNEFFKPVLPWTAEAFEKFRL